MPLVTITLYATTVVNGVVSADSQEVTLTIDDANDDGAISTSEWQSYTGNPYGHIAGETSPPALFEGNGTGNILYGTLYSPVEYAAGEDLSSVLKALEKGGGDKYNPSIDDLNICFLAGTLIATPNGDVPVESLRQGDMVLTRDHGPQPLVWTSASDVSAKVLDRAPNRRPIRIEAGALGDGLPRRAVEVSPQHRILVQDGDSEYLISARHLMMAGAPGLSVRKDDTGFTLVHIACADHQIVLAEGAAMKSFYTGPMAVKALGMAQKLGLIATFPAVGRGENPMTPARPFVNHREYSAMQRKSVSA